MYFQTYRFASCYFWSQKIDIDFRYKTIVFWSQIRFSLCVEFCFFWNRCCVFWLNVVSRCFYEYSTQFLLFCIQKIDINMQFQRKNKILKHCQLKIRSFWNFEFVIEKLSRKLYAISSFCNYNWNFVENVFWNFWI